MVRILERPKSRIATQDVVVGLQVFRPLQSCPLDFDRPDLRMEGAGDALDNLVLHREQVGHVAVVVFGPELAAGTCIDQLHRQAQPLTGPTHAALDDIADSQFATELLRPDRFAFEGEAGTTIHDNDRRDAAQRRRQILDKAVSEIFIIALGAEIVERQDRNGRLVRCACA